MRICKKCTRDVGTYLFCPHCGTNQSTSSLTLGQVYSDWSALYYRKIGKKTREGYVSFDGINFAAIRMRVKKRFGTYNEYTAIEVGYSLFTWRDCKVNPHEMAQSGPFWLPLICNALLIQGNAADAEVQE